MFRLSSLFLAAIAASSALAPSLASAETKQITVPRGKASGLFSLGAYDRINCGIYPIHNVHIDSAPAHGAAQVIDHVVSLSKDTGLCAGKSYKAPVIVYKPAGNYSGPDRLTIKWMAPMTTEAVREVENRLDVEITVK